MISSLLAVGLLCGCAIDTELGLAVEVRAARVDVRADPVGEVVGTSIDIEYRVGPYAQGGVRELRPQAIEVYTVDDVRVVGVTPDRPADFVPRLSPGESRQATLTGQSDPGEATDPRRLCGLPAVLLFRWIDVTTNEIGLSEGMVGVVACD